MQLAGGGCEGPTPAETPSPSLTLGKGQSSPAATTRRHCLKKNSHIVKLAQCPKVKISRHLPLGLLFHSRGLVSGLLYKVRSGCLPHSQK